MILGLTGMPGSGKTTVADYLRDKYRFSIINMGDVVRNAMSAEGLEINSESLREFSENMRKAYGYAAIAQMTVKVIGNKYKGKRLCIDGIRSPWEIRYFKDTLNGEFIMLAIDCPTEIRYSRLLARSRKDDPQTKEGLSKRDEKEEEFGVLEAIKLADFKLSNTSTIEALYRDLDMVLKNTEKRASKEV
ncbi:MAG: nucleoside monophosphate kinase [Candidatus Micrarchaeia archaeon]